MSVEQDSPATRVSTPVDGVDVLGALSPSRAGDFMTCPLLYRFRTIDRLPEAFSPDAVRGTVIHKVLEDLFDLPAADRTPERADAMLEPAWETLVEQEPTLHEMFDAAEGPEITSWLTSCRDVLSRYFTLEDPRRLEPAERELYVETLLDSKLLLRGFVDRIDIAPDGRIRVVDYKGLALDTPLPTPTGWTTMGSVQVGDDLVGLDGRPTKVVTKSDVHQRPCYRLTFHDGSEVVCDNVHLWSVVTSHRQVTSRQTIDTTSLHELHQQLVAGGTPRSLWIESADGLVCEDDADLPVDPWLLGAWLGDGATRSGQITVGREDLDDMLVLFKERWNREIRVRAEGTAMSVTLSRLTDRCTFGHDDFRPPTAGHASRRCRKEESHAGLEQWNVSLGRQLATAGVIGNKHIPAPYLRAGRQQRIDLLRGLLDTDGWWNKIRHRAGFTTTDDRLADGVVEVLRTLGINPCHFQKPYTNRPGRTWHVIEFTPIGFNPFSLPRKAQAAAEGVTDLQRTLARRRVLRSVVPVESVPTQCVAVDARDSMYLCGKGFVPTHNTGSSPGEMFEGKALFQMKFYALVIWKTRGVVPAMLQLVYLGNGEILRYVPDEADLLATQRKVEAVWQAIRRAEESGDWRPSPGRLCAWCSHQAICPAYGGTPPPLPEREPGPVDQDVAAETA
ncbi:MULTISPECIES: PD-(D/E)XK nuclease family protein [unclassified Nocardioides]|uniref:PD-(D/E)XK nuclease family protein n=1 Tax=unclassified Nocardioides TaxID=2615069 RepID=UPI00362437B7